jgi:hypothetical protein
LSRRETGESNVGSDRFTIFESGSRPLIRLAPHGEEEHRNPVRRIATFLTHLIATDERVPQAREKRRADPAEVIAAYKATIDRLRKLDN